MYSALALWNTFDLNISLLYVDSVKNNQDAYMKYCVCLFLLLIDLVSHEENK